MNRVNQFFPISLIEMRYCKSKLAIPRINCRLGEYLLLSSDLIRYQNFFFYTCEFTVVNLYVLT